MDDGLGPVNKIEDLRPIGTEFEEADLARDRFDTDPMDYYITWRVVGYSVCARGHGDKRGIWLERIEPVNVREEYSDVLLVMTEEK